MEQKKIKIALVDDHRMFREGMKFLLSNFNFVEVVGEYCDGSSFLDDLDMNTPDLVLMDINMPGISGIDATSAALRKNRKIKVIALSMFGDMEYYQKMVQAGAKGFLVKESGSDELEKAIQEVMSGGNYFSQQLLQHIILNIGKEEKDKASRPEVHLSKREEQVLKMICSGLTNAEIAEELSLSLRTVEGHRGRLISRLGVKNSIQLVLFVLRHKIVELEPVEPTT